MGTAEMGTSQAHCTDTSPHRQITKYLIFCLASAVEMGVGLIKVALVVTGCCPCFAVMIKPVDGALPDELRAARILAKDWST